MKSAEAKIETKVEAAVPKNDKKSQGTLHPNYKGYSIASERYILSCFVLLLLFCVVVVFVFIIFILLSLLLFRGRRVSSKMAHRRKFPQSRMC